MKTTPWLMFCLQCLTILVIVSSQTSTSVHGTCNNITTPQYGTLTCQHYENLTSCIATCNDGYRFETMSAVEKRICDRSNNVWFIGNRFPRCIALRNQDQCHPLPPPDNGIVRCEHTGTTLICTATCNSGYIFETNASIVKKICDTYDGIWYNGKTLPACVSRQTGKCQVPVAPQDGMVRCHSEQDRLICTAICNEGYKFKSMNMSIVKKICILSNGLWIDGNVNFPKCTDTATTKKCSAIQASMHNIIRCEDSYSILKCTATCKSGYEFETSDKVVLRMCDQNGGNWLNSNTIPKCIGKCEKSLMGTLPDDKFTASSRYFSASKARIIYNTSQDGHSNLGWQPQFDDLNQFIQVELYNVSKVIGIVTKGLRGSDSYITRYRILHSLDGRMFTPYGDDIVSDKFLTGNSDSETAVKHIFSCPFSARYVRVNPLEWHGHIGIRFDVLGCEDNGGQKEISTQRQPTTNAVNPQTVTSDLVTQSPKRECISPGPPTNGVVYCQGTSSELVCTAQCKDGFEFSTKETLIKRACDKRDGMWINGDSYPPCIALPTQLPAPTPTDRTCISSQVDCLNKKNGDFQTCGACHFYASCSEGYVYVRPCPINLQFDLTTGRCEFQSKTCFHADPNQLIGK